jgi:hypothetical protein
MELDEDNDAWGEKLFKLLPRHMGWQHLAVWMALVQRSDPEHLTTWRALSKPIFSHSEAKFGDDEHCPHCPQHVWGGVYVSRAEYWTGLNFSCLSGHGHEQRFPPVWQARFSDAWHKALEWDSVDRIQGPFFCLDAVESERMEFEFGLPPAPSTSSTTPFLFFVVRHARVIVFTHLPSPPFPLVHCTLGNCTRRVTWPQPRHCAIETEGDDVLCFTFFCPCHVWLEPTHPMEPMLLFTVASLGFDLLLKELPLIPPPLATISPPRLYFSTMAGRALQPLFPAVHNVTPTLADLSKKRRRKKQKDLLRSSLDLLFAEELGERTLPMEHSLLWAGVLVSQPPPYRASEEGYVLVPSRERPSTYHLMRLCRNARQETFHTGILFFFDSPQALHALEDQQLFEVCMFRDPADACSMALRPVPLPSSPDELGRCDVAMPKQRLLHVPMYLATDPEATTLMLVPERTLFPSSRSSSSPPPFLI